MPAARAQQRIRLSTRVLLIALPIAAVALFASLYPFLDMVPASLGAWAAILAAMALYAASHVLRAARLAVLAAPALNLHVRTVLLLHFHTAPVSFIVPFKLGELYRWQQLAWLSKNVAGSLLILLLDRMLDAVVLLVVLAVLVVVGSQVSENTAAVAGLLALATTLGVFAVLILPGCLEAMQAYILQNHSALRARRVLRVVDSTRRMINSARKRLQGNVVLLLFMSAAIWACESGMLIVLTHQLKGAASFVMSLLTRTLLPQAGDGPTIEILSLYVLVCLLTLLPLWVVATVIYLRRVQSPLRSVAPPQQLLSARRTRRLHLRATAKTL